LGAGEIGRGMTLIKRHTELKVYKRSFEVTKTFPKEERYSLVDQVRRSSRSVCANLAEAWRKRRYQAAFISKLSDSEAEASETQVWIQFSVECEYLDRESAKLLYSEYDEITAMLVHMINHPNDWTIK
jgi:four helix bundle protein